MSETSMCVKQIAQIRKRKDLANIDSSLRSEDAKSIGSGYKMGRLGRPILYPL